MNITKAGISFVILSMMCMPYEAAAYGIDSPRPCIAEKKCEVENPHWNNAITKVSVTYKDEMKNTHQWTKMINSAEGIKDCDVAARAFPYRFETCPQVTQ